MSHENNNEDLQASLTGDEVSKIVNSERLQQAIKDTHDAWEKTKFKWQIFVALIMAFSAAFGYYLKWDSERKDRVEQQIQVDNERKAEEIQAVINQKMEWMRSGVSTIMEMRRVDKIIIMHCKYTQNFENYSDSIIRINARYKVINAFDGIQFIFDNNVQDAVRKLTSYDENILNICDKYATLDNSLHNYQIEINNLMGNSIQRDQKKLETLK